MHDLLYHPVAHATMLEFLNVDIWFVQIGDYFVTQNMQEIFHDVPI